MAASVTRRVLRTTCKLAYTPKPIKCISIQTRLLSFSRCLADRFYTEKHEWVSIDNGKGTVGISDYAQEQLGEIVYVETPEVGATLEPEDVSGCLESVKAASEVYSPVGGTVTEVNQRLADEPGLVNSSPLGDGWLYKLDVASNTKTDKLMKEEAYKKFIDSLGQD